MIAGVGYKIGGNCANCGSYELVELSSSLEESSPTRRGAVKR